VRSKWRGGRWASWKRSGIDEFVFEVLNEWHKKACDEGRLEVEKVLNDHFGFVNVEVVVGEPDLGDIKVDLGEIILTTRKMFDLSQGALGKRIGVDQSMISSWERGTALPSLDRIFNLDMAFGLQPGTLLVRAGLVGPDAIESAVRRSHGQVPANVARIEVEADGVVSKMSLQPRLTAEQWQELARSMIGDDESASKVTKVAVTAPGDDYPQESSFERPKGGLDLEELLRLVRILLDSQGTYEEPGSGWGGWDGRRTASTQPPAYDPSEEPF
jgi:transcriptional regulator with XRE-family HTH domain